MLRKFLLVLFFFLSAGSLLAADLTVKILNSKKKPFGGVLACKLTNVATKEDLPTSTNEKSEVTFEKLATGTYVFSSAKPGFVPVVSKAIQMDSKNVELSVVLVEEKKFREFEQAGNTAFQQQNYAEANSQYAKAYEMAPFHADLCANYVRTLMRTGDARKAADVVKTTGEYGPDGQKLVNASMRFEEGRMALEAQDFKKAEAALTEATQGDPENADAYYGLALALGHQKRYIEAVKPITMAVTLKPDDEQYKKVKQSIEHNAWMTGK
jgi:hypothetical protein